MSLIKNKESSKTKELVSEQQIQFEWDSNVQARALELESELDKTYFELIIPTILNLAHKYAKGNEVLDLGCGLGFLSKKLNDLDFDVTAIDISKESIQYAKNAFGAVKFVWNSIIDFGRFNSNKFDLCIANMVFHNCLSLQDNISEVSSLLKYKGVLIVSIPHPTFWYEKRKGMKYLAKNKSEEIYKIKFKINGSNEHPSPITFIQRSLSTYMNTFTDAGFLLKRMIEPVEMYGEKPSILIMVFHKT